MKKIIFLFLLTSNFLFAQPGAFDPNFLATVSVNGNLETIVPQNDGKILLGGSFSIVNGLTMNRLTRLNSDGSLDSGFVTGAGFNNTVRDIEIQPDGKIIVVGNFTNYKGVAVNRIVRLNPDGTVDASFNGVGTGANNQILSIELLSDGKILIGGSFSSYNGSTTARFVKLNNDGSLDATFNVGGSGATDNVNAITLQSDGKILIGGNFSTFNGTPKGRITRLNADGSLDSGFVTSSFNAGSVNKISVLSDNSVLVAGSFSNVASDATKKYLVKLSTAGTLDATYNSFGFDAAINAMNVDSDGKIYVGGLFTNYNGTARLRVARLNSDATLDTAFNPSGANAVVLCLAVQSDGKLLVGGNYTQFNGVLKNRLVRVNAYNSISLTAASCGATLPTLTSSVYAEYISGLQAYRFKVTNTTTSAVQIFERPVNNLALSSIPGMAYNTQYKIEVAAKINNVWESYYGKPCFVNSPNPVSNINPAQCGQFLTAMNQWVTTDYVLNVTAYKFRVTNLTTPSPVQEIITSANKFNMTQLASRSFDSEYLVEVALKNTDGTFLPYGPSTCTIKTPKFPQTQVVLSQCESTVANFGTMVNADYVANATVYRFFIFNEGLEFSATLDRSLNKFNFSMLPGVTPGASYTVLVAVKIDGVFGPYGKTCTVFLPGMAKISSTKDTKQAFEVVSYPNPFSSDFKLQLQTSSNETVSVKVYDMLGRKVQENQFSVSDLENTTLGTDLPSGVYNAVIQQGQDSKAVRIVKR